MYVAVGRAAVFDSFRGFFLKNFFPVGYVGLWLGVSMCCNCVFTHIYGPDLISKFTPFLKNPYFSAAKVLTVSWLLLSLFPLLE